MVRVGDRFAKGGGVGGRRNSQVDGMTFVSSAMLIVRDNRS